MQGRARTPVPAAAALTAAAGSRRTRLVRPTARTRRCTWAAGRRCSCGGRGCSRRARPYLACPPRPRPWRARRWPPAPSPLRDRPPGRASRPTATASTLSSPPTWGAPSPPPRGRRGSPLASSAWRGQRAGWCCSTRRLCTRRGTGRRRREWCWSPTCGTPTCLPPRSPPWKPSTHATLSATPPRRRRRLRRWRRWRRCRVVPRVANDPTPTGVPAPPPRAPPMAGRLRPPPPPFPVCGAPPPPRRGGPPLL